MLIYGFFGVVLGLSFLSDLHTNYASMQSFGVASVLVNALCHRREWRQ